MVKRTLINLLPNLTDFNASKFLPLPVPIFLNILLIDHGKARLWSVRVTCTNYSESTSLDICLLVFLY